MKKTILLVLLASLSLTAQAKEVREMFLPIEPTVQIVITNQPCTKFKAAETVQLNYAYAINTETGDTVTGCFTHEGDIIHIELVDDKGNFYSYKKPADLFLPRPNL